MTTLEMVQMCLSISEPHLSKFSESSFFFFYDNTNGNIVNFMTYFDQLFKKMMYIKFLTIKGYSTWMLHENKYVFTNDERCQQRDN